MAIDKTKKAIIMHDLVFRKILQMRKRGVFGMILINRNLILAEISKKSVIFIFA